MLFGFCRRVPETDVMLNRRRVGSCFLGFFGGRAGGDGDLGGRWCARAALHVRRFGRGGVPSGRGRPRRPPQKTSPTSPTPGLGWVCWGCGGVLWGLRVPYFLRCAYALALARANSMYWSLLFCRCGSFSRPGLTPTRVKHSSFAPYSAASLKSRSLMWFSSM